MLSTYLSKNHKPINEIIIEKITKLLVDQNCILFGAGAGGEKVCSFIRENIESGNDKIECFVDNNPLKWETDFMGKTVFSAEEKFTSYQGQAVIISCGEGDEIIAQLGKYGVPNEKIYIPDIAVLQENDIDFIHENLDCFEWLYDHLEDQKSREVLIGILNYKLTHEISQIQRIADKSEDQYFDQELITYSKDDVFLDCGGYVGDTIESYCAHNGGVYGRVICLEPDPDNYKIIEREFRDCQVELHNVAAYSKETELYFDKIGSGSGTIMSGKQAKIQKTVVHGNTIDNICEGGGESPISKWI